VQSDTDVEQGLHPSQKGHAHKNSLPDRRLTHALLADSFTATLRAMLGLQAIVRQVDGLLGVTGESSYLLCTCQSQIERMLLD
jgi:hypothetical protein